MEKWLYVMLIEKTELYNKLTKAGVERHVANLKRLDEQGNIEMAGILKGFPGVSGMYILRAESYEAAEEICKQEPLIVEGFATYKLISFQPANKENNYLL